MTAALCALFLAVSCLTGPGPNLASDGKLAASERMGQAVNPGDPGRPLNDSPGAPGCTPR